MTLWRSLGRPMPDPRAFLAQWGLADAPCALVATRENQTFRVETPQGLAALRLRRPGLRSHAELASELAWTAALAEAGLIVPAPFPTRNGQLVAQVDGHTADLVRWIDGTPLSTGAGLVDLPDGEGTFFALGETAARLHDICDAWAPPADFVRHAWDTDGLLGETPVWGRFWENPHLSPEQRDLVSAARHRALEMLTELAPSLDYGLIHADLTHENVILTDDGPALIDFDDGGWGFRAFELATVINHTRRSAAPEPLIAALIDGYQSRRAFDTQVLPLFQALRAFTYLGWIVPRLAEPGAAARATRFVTQATDMAAALLASSPLPKAIQHVR